MSQPVLVGINILGIEYNISCIPDETEALKKSAQLLNKRLIELKEEGGLTTDQASMMVALNFANELLKAEGRFQEMELSIKDKLVGLSKKIDAL